METNRKILKMGIVLISTLVIIGYIGVYLLTLDEPVVIEHYIEEQIYTLNQQGARQISLDLYYITNSTDDRVVNRVEFPEHPELQATSSEFGMHGGFNMFLDTQQQVPGSIEGRYSMRTVYLEFFLEENYQNGEAVEITKADIHLSDGSVFEAEIGSINFNIDEERNDIVDYDSISGSNYQTVTELNVEEDIELIGIESRFLSLIQDNLELNVNGRDFQEIEGMKIEAGEKIYIESDVKSEEVMEGNILYLKLWPEIRFIRGNGKEETARLMAGWFQRHEYGFFEIIQYLQDKGEL